MILFFRTALYKFRHTLINVYTVWNITFILIDFFEHFVCVKEGQSWKTHSIWQFVHHFQWNRHKQPIKNTTSLINHTSVNRAEVKLSNWAISIPQKKKKKILVATLKTLLPTNPQIITYNIIYNIKTQFVVINFQKKRSFPRDNSLSLSPRRAQSKATPLHRKIDPSMYMYMLDTRVT